MQIIFHPSRLPQGTETTFGMVRPSGLIIDNATNGGNVVVAPGKVASVTMETGMKGAPYGINFA
jgi:hypothetical protein